MINNEQSLLYIDGKFRPAKSGKTYPNIAPATGGTIGTAADGSTEDITSVATWTSSTPTVAVVNQNGVASSAIHGQTNIAAQFKGVTGSTLLSVN